MGLLSSLNKEQKEAVLYNEGPLLILAGPGSGKTKTLTHKIAYLIKSGVEPQSILAVTFTNKAAEEMRERALALLTAHGQRLTAGNGDKPSIIRSKLYAISSKPSIGTFHSISARFLRENASLLGFTSRFTIYDEADQLSLIKKIIKAFDLDSKQYTASKILHTISRAKDNLILPDEYLSETRNPHENKIGQLYVKYQEELQKNDSMDFDDLIMNTVLLLKNNPLVLKKYRAKFKYILVDEYQDTNILQNKWLNLLVSKKAKLCVVGDDAQSIYGWRNAKIENILSFKEVWPQAKIVKLEQNYRSTKNIVRAASQVIENSTQGYSKNLWTENPKGELVYIKEVSNEREEAGFILEEIEKQVEDKGYKMKDFVVLYRTNAQSRPIEEMFLRYDMPYKIVGGIRFYQRQEIKDVIAWLRLLQNKNDAPSRERLEKLKLAFLKEVIPGKIKNKNEALKKLYSKFEKKLKENNCTLTELTKHIIKESNYEKMLRDGTERGEERWQNVQELLSITREFNKINTVYALEKFLEKVTLMQEADSISYESDIVHLMTLHMAKGLEFPVVFITGCEEGILPHASSMVNQRELDEERRLFYVGLTRAKEKVYLLFSRQRNTWGSLQSNPPSNFIFDLPEECLEFHPLEAEFEKNILDI